MILLDPLAEAVERRRYVPLDTSEHALAALAAHLREGRSPVLLTGPSGIGKTLLLRVFAEREQGPLQRVRVSESLETVPDELAGWLLHYLFRQRAPEGTDAEIALLERLHGSGAERMLLLVDQIQHAPPESVRRLGELARAGVPELAVVVAGSDGKDLHERIANLAPEAMVSLPASLPDTEIATLYAAILADPGMSPRLRGRLASVERSEILCAAAGLPLLLKKELIRREERTTAPAPQLRRMDRPLATRPARAAPAAVAVQLKRRFRRRFPPVRFLRGALRACASMITSARDAAGTSLRNASALAVRARRKFVTLACAAAGGVRGSSSQLVRAGAESVRLSIEIIQARVRSPCKRLMATTARAGPAGRAHLMRLRGRLTLLPTRIGATSRRAGAGIRQTSTVLSRPVHDGLLRLKPHRRRVRAWLASMARWVSGVQPASLSHSLRWIIRTGSVAPEVARRTARRAAPGAGLSAIALLVISVLYLGRPEVAVPRIPTVSSAPLERLPDEPDATPSATAIHTSVSVVNVQVNAQPWALVRIGGRDLGPTPLSRRLAPGVYELEARFPDGRTLRRNIEVSRERRFVSLP